jgi:UDP-N-acetylmuramate dehydrogenase
MSITAGQQPPTVIDRLLAELAVTFGDRTRRNEPLAAHTTFRIGGPAEVWLAVESAAELVQAVTLARQHGWPAIVLGSGANVLVSDAGVRGLVIENRAGRVDFPPLEETEAGAEVALTAESGVVLPGLARRCARRGLSGLEWAVGVPGTVGGAVVNNAGAYGSDLAHNLVEAELLSPGGERLWQPAAWFEYGYRNSRLKKLAASDRWIVLQARLRLQVAPPAEIEARMAAFNEQRKASQPPGATIGSMFKNPPGDYAGRLIEAAGLKGYRQGQAQISPVHANFFQNLGDATATDVMALIQTARTAVKQKFGIELELEIELVGEFGGVVGR